MHYLVHVFKLSSSHQIKNYSKKFPKNQTNTENCYKYSPLSHSLKYHDFNKINSFLRNCEKTFCYKSKRGVLRSSAHTLLSSVANVSNWDNRLLVHMRNQFLFVVSKDLTLFQHAMAAIAKHKDSIML